MALIQDKIDNLKQNLIKYGKVAVAYSSGVDSTFLLKVAHDTLGENAIAITSNSCFFTGSELQEAKKFCNAEGIELIVVDLDVLGDPDIRSNPVDRCYYCKHRIFSTMIELAQERGFSVVAEGSNMDDLGDYRPGLKAIEELGVASPLRQALLYKEEIRELSRELGLETWKKPSMACLASRIEYGETITEEALKMVENAEAILRNMKFSQFRVRKHGNIARIEVSSSDFFKIIDENCRKIIIEEFQKIGFLYITLDLNGYRCGSMNESFLN